jgi:hypothetical protein
VAETLNANETSVLYHEFQKRTRIRTVKGLCFGKVSEFYGGGFGVGTILALGDRIESNYSGGKYGTCSNCVFRFGLGRLRSWCDRNRRTFNRNRKNSISRLFGSSCHFFLGISDLGKESQRSPLGVGVRQGYCISFQTESTFTKSAFKQHTRE